MKLKAQLGQHDVCAAEPEHDAIEISNLQRKYYSNIGNVKKKKKKAAQTTTQTTTNQ